MSLAVYCAGAVASLPSARPSVALGAAKSADTRTSGLPAGLPERPRAPHATPTMERAPRQAPAPTLTARDCAEGADFIGNAARSRDAGMKASQFLDRLEQDLIVVMGMRPAVRWFVYGEREAQMLRAASRAVFDRPQPPKVHARAFRERCDASRGGMIRIVDPL
ncbi:MAG: hypothetical protein R3E48_08840 [Burkholderiaceae bacterium]